MKFIFVLVAGAVLGGCASFDPYNIIGRHLPPMNTRGSAQHGEALTTDTRQIAIEQVWQTINDRYYRADFNGIDWHAAREKWQPLALAVRSDDEFWDALDQMTGELADSHTRVESPQAVARRKTEQTISLGLNLRELDGDIVVLGVHPESDAYWSGVRAGMRLRSIAGVDALVQWKTWQREVRKTSSAQAGLRLPLGKLNQVARQASQASTGGGALRLEFERTDGTSFDVMLGPRAISTRPAASHRVLLGGIGYIRLTGFQESLRVALLDAVAALANTPALILDLRGNGGGSAAMADALIGIFFAQRTLIGYTETRSGQPVSIGFGAITLTTPERYAPGRVDAYKGRVAVLQDADSASASEATAAALQSTGRAIVVGETSCGCLLMYLGYATLPGGGELAYSEVGFRSVRGDRIEGRGVVPDVAVARSREDIRTSRDRALEMAQAALVRQPDK